MTRKQFQILLCSAALVTAGAAAEAQPFGRGGPDRANMAQRISMVLRLADGNGDNTITRSEVEEFQMEIFEWMDRNSDGYLDEADQSPMSRRMAELREREQAERGLDGEEEPRRRPRRGGHGRGGPDGMMGMGPMGGPLAPPRGVDTDEDGRISREEFLTMENRLFDRLDSNEDGAITPDELDEAVERGEERREGRRFWWRD